MNPTGPAGGTSPTGLTAGDRDRPTAPAGRPAGRRGAPDPSGDAGAAPVARHGRVFVVGDLGMDVLVAPRRAPAIGGDVPAAIRMLPGGAGANTAAWLAHLGAEVTLVSRVGDDAAGRAATAQLRAAGVVAAVAVDGRAPTCTVVVLQERGERTMLSDRGAAALLAAGDLPALAAGDHLHLSGYVLADPRSRATGLAALAAAGAAGASTSVDPQSSGLDGEVRAGLRGVDLLLPNAAELAALGGSPRRLLAEVGAVVVTDGPRGARWVDRRGSWAVPAPRVDAVDPTGAGDAFDAGLLVAWLGGAGPREALLAGCAAGAAAVSRHGARPQRPPGPAPRPPAPPPGEPPTQVSPR